MLVTLQRNPKIHAIGSELKLIRVPNNSKLLDVGCGNGSLTIFVAEALGIKEIYGIDTNEAALSEARKRGIKTLKLDVQEKFPFPTIYFDVIMFFDVIEHLRAHFSE